MHSPLNRKIVARLFDQAHCCQCVEPFGDRLTVIGCDRIHADGNGGPAVGVVCDPCLEQLIVALDPARDGYGIRRETLADVKFAIVDHGLGFSYVDVNTLPATAPTGFTRLQTYHRAEVADHAA